jgi:hypothetical protein
MQLQAENDCDILFVEPAYDSDKVFPLQVSGALTLEAWRIQYTPVPVAWHSSHIQKCPFSRHAG